MVLTVEGISTAKVVWYRKSSPKLLRYKAVHCTIFSRSTTLAPWITLLFVLIYGYVFQLSTYKIKQLFLAKIILSACNILQLCLILGDSVLIAVHHLLTAHVAAKADHLYTQLIRKSYLDSNSSQTLQPCYSLNIENVQ